VCGRETKGGRERKRMLEDEGEVGRIRRARREKRM
jgi:hypothetical protein